METINQELNRLTAENDKNHTLVDSSLSSMLWHIVLYGRISVKDSLFLDSLTPQHCSLFLVNDSKTIYASDTLLEKPELITTNMNFSYEASYAQQVCDNKNGLFRILTIPLNKNILIGLAAPAGLGSISTIEDAFLHKICHFRQEHSHVVHSRDNLYEATKKTDPILIINRSDDQIIGCNKSALSFFNITSNDIIDTDLQILQKKCSKASKRKIQITNSTIGKTDCSVVQFTLNKSDSLKTENITEELKSHAEHLIKLYRELQIEQNIRPEHIKTKIAAVNRCYQNISQLHTNEKKEHRKHTGHTDAVKR